MAAFSGKYRSSSNKVHIQSNKCFGSFKKFGKVELEPHRLSECSKLSLFSERDRSARRLAGQDYASWILVQFN